MSHRHGLWLAAALIAAAASIGPAAAQKQGGTLRSYIWDNPPSASIHEEATISTVFPFMPVFNNLVVFDQTKLESSLDTIVPDLALSWTWDAPKTRVTFKLAEGVKWHDGKPFTAKDVKCTFDLVAGLTSRDDFRKNPRKVWYHNVAVDHGQRRPRGLLPAQGAATLLPGAAGLGLLADLSLPRAAEGHARQADRHRPVQGRRVQAGRIGRAGAQCRLLEEGPAAARRHRVPGDRQPLDPRAGLHGRRHRPDVRVGHHGRGAQGRHRQGAERRLPVRAVEQHDQPDRQSGERRRSTSWRSGRRWRSPSTGAPSTPSSPRASR